MTHGEAPIRVVGFLGTSAYEEADYRLGNQHARSRYAPMATARLLGAKDLTLLATQKARDTHQAGVEQEGRASGLRVDFRTIPEGRSEAEFREVFRHLRDCLSSDRDRPLALDITLGYRAQPFFSAAALATLAAAERLPPETRIFYGEYERNRPDANPVWELTPVLQMIRFALAGALFLGSGDGRRLADELDREVRWISQRARAGERDYARSKVAKPLRVFSQDLAANRVVDLLVGREGKPASSIKLKEAIEKWRDECDRDHPALVPMLDDLQGLCARLVIAPEDAAAQGLAARGARLAMAALARWYLESGRLTEAAAVAREEIVNRLASSPAALRAGSAHFDEEARKRAERAAGEAKNIRGLFDWRNDLLHAGFRADPQPGDKLAKNVRTLVDQIREAPKACVVTRHPGAIEWIRRQGIIADETLPHLDDETLARLRPGDRVVGVLPPRLVADLCARGVRCDLLIVPCDADNRGMEWSADDLERAGAYLMRARMTLEPLGPD